MKKLLFFLLPIALNALPEDPWLADPLEFQWLFRGDVAHFNSIDTSSGPIAYSSSPILGKVGLSFAIPDWQVAIEGNGAKTKKEETFVLTDGAACVRYALLDDVSGRDKASLTLGLMGQFPLGNAIHDPSLLYSAYCQGEFQVSLGKELTCGRYWDYHFWAFGAFGAGSQGSPWLRGILAIEKNIRDRQRIALWVEGREGLGENPFPLLQFFTGYGPIHYSFTDLHLRYTWSFWYTNWLNIEYMIRVGAQNCPAHRQALALSFVIPFGL